MASRAQQTRRRRRNGFLAAIALAVVIIVIIIIIIVSIASRSKNSGNVSSIETPTPTNNTTLAPYSPSTPTPGPTGSSASPSPSAGTPTSVMYVTKDSVNVRKAASTDSDKLTSVDTGTAVTVLSTEKKDGFINVRLSNGTEGYIFAEYLSATATSTSSASATPTSAAATPNTSKSTTMYVTADSVNMRKEASSSSDRVTRLNKDTKVTAYETKDGWTYIQYNGKYGYISAQYLKNSPSSQSPTASNVTPTPSGGTTTSPTPTPVHAKSFSEVGLPDGIVSALGDQTTYLSMTKAQRYVDTGEANGFKYYKIAKLDSGYYFVAYKGDEVSGFTDVKITDSLL